MASKKKGPRQTIGLKCKNCNKTNYVSEMNKNNLQLKKGLTFGQWSANKFCNNCHSHQTHSIQTKLK